MTWTDQQIEAYNQLEAAIEGMIVAFDSLPNGEFLAGWIVCLSGASNLKDTELYEEDDDEIATASQSAYYYKRGQHPMLTRGIVERCRDRIADYA